jgi:hypothetical protein
MLPLHQDSIAVGFDIEWPPTFRKGKSNRSALLQMCIRHGNATDTAAPYTCFLFHLSAIASRCCRPPIMKALTHLQAVTDYRHV